MKTISADDAKRKRLPAPAVPSPVLETLRSQFEELGLSGNEARVLLALFQLGEATAPQLGRLSSVPRTSVYPILEGLYNKRLAEPLAEGSAVWGTPGREEVLNRLFAAKQRYLYDLQTTVEQARETLASTFPETPSPSLPFVHVVPNALQVHAIYDQLLSDVESEVLVFNRVPYSWAPGKVNQRVIDALARGVSARALYEARPLEDPNAEGFRQEHEVYMGAGVEARVVDELPIKLAVFDRQVTLLAMTVPGVPDSAYPTVLHVEHAGYAAAHVASFEYYWMTGTPYQEFTVHPSDKSSDGDQGRAKQTRRPSGLSRRRSTSR